MPFKVRLQPAAVDDLDEAFKYAAQHAPLTATRWLERFHQEIGERLSYDPNRCQLAEEDKRSDRTIRQYLFGKRPNIYRVIFTVEADTVWILRIRRAQRRPLSPTQLGEPNE